MTGSANLNEPIVGFPVGKDMKNRLSSHILSLMNLSLIHIYRFLLSGRVLVGNTGVEPFLRSGSFCLSLGTFFDDSLRRFYCGRVDVLLSFGHAAKTDVDFFKLCGQYWDRGCDQRFVGKEFFDFGRCIVYPCQPGIVVFCICHIPFIFYEEDFRCLKSRLLSPPTIWKPILEPVDVYKRQTMYYPYWLCYAAGVCMDRGYDVELVDCIVKKMSTEDVVELVQKSAPDYIMGEITTSTCFHDYETLAAIKKAYPQGKIIIGGTHATALSERVLEECPDIDVIVRQEYDFTLDEVMKAGADLSDVLGITWRLSLIHI